jgi:L-ascorbate metabolism protein UlaG (beta-lactamase superfamily)
MATLTFHGHATFSLRTSKGARLVFDPFFTENPLADVGVEDVEADYVLVSHGHADHFGDCVPLAKRTGATVISTVEIVRFCREQGVKAGHGMNIGGAHRFPFGRVKLTAALHTGTVAGDEQGTHTTVSCGFLVEVDGVRLYHAGDTALTFDMQLLKGQVDVALLPIGDNYTMGPEDAARAVELIEPRLVIPMHYDTWDLIAQDPEAFRALVGDRARVQVLGPGGEYRL